VSGRDHRSMHESSPYRKHNTKTASGRCDVSDSSPARSVGWQEAVSSVRVAVSADRLTRDVRSDQSFPINGAKISEVDPQPRKRVRELDTNMSYVDTGLGDRVEPPFTK